MELLIQVVKSWQVIAVTVALVLYMFLVGYAARTYRRPSRVSKTKPLKKSKSKTAAAAKASKQESPTDTNDELGLTEA